MRRYIILLFLFAYSQNCVLAQCDFDIPNTACGGENISFTVNNPSGAVYTWDFNDDGTIDATGISVGHVFPPLSSNQNYLVTLYADGIACDDELIQILAVPDATIGLVPGGDAVLNGNNINACNGSPDVYIEIFNNSTTVSSNSSYQIDWGDGSDVENYTNTSFSSAISIGHDYSGFGYKTLSVTVTGTNGCAYTQNYTFYNGGNPSIGLGNPGNTVGLCAPATISFPISDYENNPAGTSYEIFVNDVLVDNFTQSTIQSPYSYTFNETSCGEETSTGQFSHAFDIKIVASNPCGASAATVEPIELSASPQANFTVDEPVNSCPDEIWTFTDNSTGINEVLSGNPTTCENELLPSWSISPNLPGVSWNLTDGNLFSSEAISVEFLQSGSYTITMTLNSIACGPSTYSETIFVLEPPVADADLANVPDDCVPANVSFNNLSSGFQMNYTWSVSPMTGWSFTNGTNENSEDPDFVFTAAGTYTLSLTTSNICDFDTWDTTLVFLAPPTIDLTPTPDQCQSAVLNFNSSNLAYNANGGTITSYSWSFPGATPASSNLPFPTGIQYSGAGTYIYTLTAVGAECGPTTVSDTFEIINPVELSLPDDLTLCVDDAPITLTASHSPGNWSGTGVSSTGVFDPSTAILGPNELTYTYGSGFCVATETMTITVSDLPAVAAGNDMSACESVTAVTLNATPAGGTWTSNNGGVVNGNVFNPNASGPNNYTLTYTYTDPITNCTNQDQLMISVNALPALQANDTSYCNTAGLVNLPFASPTGGTWSGVGVSGNQFDPQGAGVGSSNELTYTYTDALNCTNAITITISVTNPANVNAGMDQVFCEDEGIIDLNSFATPAGGSWTANGSAGLSGSNFNLSIAGSGGHTLTYEFGTGNCAVSDDIEITVNPLPTIDIANNPISACVSETSIVLNSSPDENGWTVNNGGVLNGNVFNPNASGAGEYTLSYNYTDPITLCTNTEQLIFTVHDLPQISVNDTTYCNTPGLVELPFASPVNGVWSGTGVTNNIFDPQASGVGDEVQLTYTYTDANNCINDATVSIFIVDPVAVDAGADASFCEDITSYDLMTLASPSSGTWDANGHPGLSGSIFNPSVAGPGTYTFTYRIGTGNCEVEDDVTVTVLALPSISIANNPTSACISETSVVFNASPDNNGWSTNNGGVLNGNVFNPNASGAGEYTLSYSYTDPTTLCTNTEELTFTVHPLPVILVNDTSYCNLPGLVDLPYAKPVGGTWSGTAIVGNSQFDPIAAGGVDVYNLTYTYTNPITNCTNSRSIEITIVNPEEIEAGVDDTLCVYQGLYTIPNFLPSSGGTWSGTGIINASTGVFDPDLAGGGVHKLIYTYGVGNCQVQDSISLEVIAIPLSVGDEEDVCISDMAFPLSGNNIPNGVWTINGVETNIFDPAALGVGPHVVSYTFTDEGSGCVFEDSKIITVRALPVVDFTMPSEACVGDDVSFINNANSTFISSWTFGDGAASDETNPIHVFETTGTYTVTLVVENEFGCLDSMSQSIFVEEPPEPSFDLVFVEDCEGVTVYLSNPIIDGDDYVLDYGIGSAENFWIDTIFFPGGEDTVTYTISLTSTNFCGPTTFTYPSTIVVPPAFNANFGILPLDNDENTFCTPETIEFANISTGQIDSFTVDYGNGNFSLNQFEDQLYINETDTLQQYTITLIIYGPDCPPDTATQEIFLFPIFFQTAFNIEDDVLCVDENLVFTNFTTPYPGIEYYEFNMGDGTIVVLNDEELDDFDYAYSTSGDYTITLLASDGCSESSYSIDVSVLETPSFELNLQDYGCTGEEVVFQATNLDSMVALIYEINGDTVSFLPTFSYIFETPSMYEIRLTGRNPLTGCITTLIDSIEINENLGFPLVAAKNLNCEVLELSFTNDEISYVDWGDGDYSDVTGTSISHSYAAPGVYFVEVVHTNALGCDFIEEHMIEVEENDLEVVAYDPVLINLGEQAALGAEVSGTGSFSYRWEPANLVEEVTIRETMTTILLDNETFTIYVENENGCVKSDEMNVRVKNKQRIYIPNAFSPDGDNINDKFNIYGGPEVFMVTKFSIFDRFGDMVYELKSATPIDEVIGWDGTLKGKKLNPGVFAYFIEVEYINKETDFFEGDVTLLR